MEVTFVLHTKQPGVRFSAIIYNISLKKNSMLPRFIDNAAYTVVRGWSLLIEPIQYYRLVGVDIEYHSISNTPSPSLSPLSQAAVPTSKQATVFFYSLFKER